MGITRTATHTFHSEQIDVCARLTGDLGAHHMGGHGDRRMAQGALTLTAVPLLAEPGVHMRELSFTFLAPVFAGDTVSASVSVREAENAPDVPEGHLLLDCEVQVVGAEGAPVLAGTGVAELPRELFDELAREGS
ncbi:MaoC family dehydratase [Streptomyces sp. GSL17-111]|uniref:MaoC family dehydratase n=1 Tax=Streptomyces sp. GSL17-111 TaxID=3121596 RepID=UPI0030F3A54B